MAEPEEAAQSERLQVLSSELQQISHPLETCFNWDKVYPFPVDPLQLVTDEKFTARLNLLTTRIESQILYMSIQHQPEGLNILRQSAGAYISFVREAMIPVVSYFCSLTHEDPPPHQIRESVELIALLYSMIHQLINLLPAKFVSPDSAWLDELPIMKLDGTLRTWDQVIQFFTSLVDCVDLPHIFFVIDSVNLLDDESEGDTFRALGHLVRCLKRLVDTNTRGTRVVKIFYTGAGLSRSLCYELDERDIVFLDGAL
jgi:hypothetical protein